MSDRELFSQITADDERAFTVFVKRYKDRLFNFVARIIPERETAEDILQETFLRVYNQRKNYSPDYALSTWVYTIALNLVRSELRKRKLRRYMSLDFLKEQSSDFMRESAEPLLKRGAPPGCGAEIEGWSVSGEELNYGLSSGLPATICLY